jgi:galactokinase
LSDPSLRRICGHVVAETRRVLRAGGLLRAGGREQVTAVGGLLTVSHYSLRDQFGVSWPEADEAVAAVIDAGGAGSRRGDRTVWPAALASTVPPRRGAF